MKRLLDIGCANGSITLLLKEALKAEEVFGVELSLQGVEEARQRGIKAYQLDLDKEKLLFPDNFFDAVFAGEVIEHLFNPDHLLEEIHRVLKTNGFAVITTPNLAAWHNRIVILLGCQPYLSSSTSTIYNVGKLFVNGSIPGGAEGGTHIRAFTLRGLKELLQIHHFRVKRFTGAFIISSFLPPPLSLIASLLSRVLSIFPSLACILIVEVKKEEKKLRGRYESNSH